MFFFVLFFVICFASLSFCRRRFFAGRRVPPCAGGRGCTDIIYIYTSQTTFLDDDCAHDGMACMWNCIHVCDLQLHIQTCGRARLSYIRKLGAEIGGTSLLTFENDQRLSFCHASWISGRWHSFFLGFETTMDSFCPHGFVQEQRYNSMPCAGRSIINLLTKCVL